MLICVATYGQFVIWPKAFLKVMNLWLNHVTGDVPLLQFHLQD